MNTPSPLNPSQRDCAAGLAFLDSAEADKPAVIFSHSLCCSSMMWDAQAAALRKLNQHRTVRYDLQGHGRTAADPASCSIGSLANQVIGLADTLGIGQFSFVGSSIGGLIGLELAVRHSQRLHGLVLSNTAASMLPRERWDQRIEQVRNGEFKQLALGNMERWLPEAFKKKDRKRTAALVETAVRTDAGSYASLCGAIREADFRDDLARIRLPVLVTASTQDVMPVGVAESLAGAIPDSRLHVFADSGHLSSVDHAEEYSTVLMEFLSAIHGK